MSQSIGFIGVGQIGGGVAQLAVNAGYKVVLTNSRGPESLKETVNKLGPLASAETSKAIAQNDDIKLVVLSVPLKVVPTLLPSLNLQNKIILDTSNYYAMREGNLEVLDNRTLTTCEYVNQYLDKSNKLVKVFNNIDAVHLRVLATQDASKQTILPIAGDDSEAKSAVENFLNTIGFKAYDYGSLKDSWRSEPGAPIYGLPYIPEIPEDLEKSAAKKLFLETGPAPLTKEDAEKLLADATKSKPVGGNIKDFPKIWLEIMMESIAAAEASKKAQA